MRWATSSASEQVSSFQGWRKRVYSKQTRWKRWTLDATAQRRHQQDMMPRLWPLSLRATLREPQGPWLGGGEKTCHFTKITKSGPDRVEEQAFSYSSILCCENEYYCVRMNEKKMNSTILWGENEWKKKNAKHLFLVRMCIFSANV